MFFWNNIGTFVKLFTVKHYLFQKLPVNHFPDTSIHYNITVQVKTCNTVHKGKSEFYYRYNEVVL